MAEMDDPYAYGAEWTTHDKMLKVKIVGVVEDPDGLVPAPAAGYAHVIITGDGTIPLVPITVDVFLSMFVREDGSAPQPVLSIPRQPTARDMS